MYPYQPLEEIQNLPDNFNFDDPSFVEANRARLEEITLRDPDAFLRIGLKIFETSIFILCKTIALNQKSLIFYKCRRIESWRYG